jgi:hypothetical protein
MQAFDLNRHTATLRMSAIERRGEGVLLIRTWRKADFSMNPSDGLPLDGVARLSRQVANAATIQLVG